MTSKLMKARGAAKMGFLFSGILGFVNSSYGLEEVVAVEKFELKIIEMTSGADEILAGNITGAIESILTTGSRHSRYDRNTNLCVAYTVQGEYSSAEQHCKLAVRHSRSFGSGIQSNSGSYMAKREKSALALNNIGVLRALQGNTGDAREYFESATRSKRMSSAANRNINALEQREQPDVLAALPE